jgi:hypothetical protein
MIEIQAVISQEGMRRRLAGAHATDPVLPERPRRMRRRQRRRARRPAF